MTENSNSKTYYIPFAVKNIFGDARRAYSKLPLDDKATINSFLVLLLVLIAAGIGCAAYFSNNTTSIVLTSVLSSTAVSVIFAIFDKVSILTPIQGKLKKSVDELGDAAIKANADSSARADRNEQLIASFSAAVQQMTHYEDSSIARKLFGFDAIYGQKYDPNGLGDVFKKVDFIPDLLLKAQMHDQFWYLTSFVDNDSGFIDAVKKMVRVGVHVRLMLMQPKIDAEVVKARWKDFYRGDHTSCEEFVSYIAPLAVRILNVRREIENLNTTGAALGTFQVRFYTASLNFPLVIYSPDANGRRSGEEIACTGFYANLNAEDMPYVVWRGGLFEMTKKFKDMFEAKWKACESVAEPPLFLPKAQH